jgi:predicted lipoprotein with Yx(FWY)xxD motif
MRKTFASFAFLAALALATAACSNSNGSSGSGSGSGSASPTTAAPTSGTVDLASSKFGQVLVDSKGRTLYVFAKDKADASNCTGQCITNWPALKATGTPTAGAGIDSSLLGTIKRSDDGSTQVTYKKQPLYYFAGDSALGDVNGQNVGGIWFVVGANGTPNKATS